MPVTSHNRILGRTPGGFVARRGGGFTVAEIVLALAVMALTRAIALPLLSGFLGRGPSEALAAEQRIR